MIHHVTRATRIFIFWTLILLAVFSTGLRLFFVEITTYKAELESQISELLDVPFKIGKLRAHMRGFNPELILKDITILGQDSDNPAIQFREIRLGINVFDILKKQDLFSSAWISLVGAKLTVIRKRDGTFAVVGLKANDEKPFWLMRGGRYEILDSEVSWLDDMRQAKTQVIQHVNITLNNLSKNKHQLRMQANLPENFGKKLTLMMDFSGDLFTQGIFDGTLYVKGQQVIFSEVFTSKVPTKFMLESGETDFELWSEWEKSRMVDLTGEVSIKNGSVANQKTQSLPVDDLVAEFRWQRQAEQWQLDMSRLSLHSGEQKWPEARFSLSVDANQKLAAAVEQLDLNQASELLLFSGLLAKQYSKPLKKINLYGQLNNLVLLANLENRDFSVNGEVKDLSFLAIENLPAVQGFSGWVKGTEQKGEILLTTESAQLKLARIFRKPLEISKLYGRLGWQQNSENWHLSSQMLKLETPDIKTQNRFQVIIPKQRKASFIDWQTVLADGYDAIHSQKYFPVRRMQKPVARWLDQLLTAGRVTQGKLVFYGHSNDFPFSKGNGIFQADLEATGVGLSYSPKWPRATELDVNVRFNNDKIF